MRYEYFYNKLNEDFTPEQTRLLKEFFGNEKIADAVNAGNWDIIYDHDYICKLMGDYRYADYRIITPVLLGSGAATIDNILKKLKKIPSNFANGCEDIVGDLVIPANVEFIQYNAFSNCPNIHTIKINSPLIELSGSDIFENCANLVSVDLSNTKIKGSYLTGFEKCSSLSSILLPSSLKQIAYTAFRRCTSLTNIDIPDSVEIIGDNAFEGCNSLKKILMPKNIKDIGAYTFKDCSNLEEIIFPNDVGYVKVQQNTFVGCNNLKKIVYQGYEFRNPNQFKNHLNEIKNQYKIKNTWYRVKTKYGDSPLALHDTKKQGIKASFVNKLGLSYNHAPVFFRTEEDANAFIDAMKQSGLVYSTMTVEVYPARLGIHDKGFLKVKTPFGDCYVQSWKANAFNKGNPNVSTTVEQ